MKIFSHICLAVAMMIMAVTASAQTIVSNDITSSTTWSLAGSPYILDGYIFVSNGATLTIDPGVVVRGLDDDPANNVLPDGTSLGAISAPEDNVGALIIARDGNINAVGNAQNPIIFTAVKDDLSDPADLSCEDFGLWGGLIVLGNAVVSSPEANFDSTLGFVNNTIEGVITTNPATALLAQFGGTDDNDNSGSIVYVSIRHGGDVLTDGDEINGLTLGGVGRGTTIDFVEVLANADDGIEWFGGTVDIKHSVVTCVVDDSYDYDQGSRFRVQFAVSIGSGNRGGEHDGGDNPDDATPFGTPVFYNATYIGKPVVQGEQEILVLRDNAGGNYQNSLFYQSQQGIEIEYRYDRPSSYFQLFAVTNDPFLGNIVNLNIDHNTYCDVALGGGDNFFLNVVSDGFTGATQQQRATSNANLTAASLASGNIGTSIFRDLTCLNRTGSLDATDRDAYGFSYDLRPQGQLSAVSPFPTGGTAFFTTANYDGAVAPSAASGADWLAGWTATAEYGIVQ
ncbi:MAG: hypothetical protein AAFQ83_15620 [Bacteroidota bacterium]